MARSSGHRVMLANSLETVPTGDFDRVVMNSPFYGKHYAKHVEHALKFLKPGGTLTAILDARPDEMKADHEWQILERDLKSSLSSIEAIDAGTAPYSRALFVSSIAGKVERLARNGETELVTKALQLVRDYNASQKEARDQ